MPTGQYNTEKREIAHLRRTGKDPFQVVTLARKHTTHAINKLVDLMNGNGGKAKVIEPKSGLLVEIDIEVPASVQAKCAELIIERGYGKSPQAILLSSDAPDAMIQALPIAERIMRLRAASDQSGETTDLEASQIQEVEVVTPSTALVPTAPVGSAEDFI